MLEENMNAFYQGTIKQSAKMWLQHIGFTSGT
jgi:hypothetical protein